MKIKPYLVLNSGNIRTYLIDSYFCLINIIFDTKSVKTNM